jgi:AcrR family transcriptional regulator
MELKLSSIHIRVSEDVFLKDPESSDLGKRILIGGIDLLDDIGFKSFNFKKLSAKINTTESSIYRYFESKHKLLLYLNAWYWSWLEYKILFKTANIDDPKRKLLRAVEALTQKTDTDEEFMHINEVKLQHIIISELSKAYLTEETDPKSTEGVFKGYHHLVEMISKMILEVHPGYKFSHMLVTTIIESTHLQRFFAERMPSLTESSKKEDMVSGFFEDMIMKLVVQNEQYCHG